MREVVMNQKANLLQLEEHFYQVSGCGRTNVFHNLFPYDEIPKIAFNDRIVPHNMPEISGSQIRHSVMDSSQEHRILQIRLYIFTMHFIV